MSSETYEPAVWGFLHVSQRKHVLWYFLPLTSSCSTIYTGLLQVRQAGLVTGSERAVAPLRRLLRVDRVGLGGAGGFMARDCSF